MRIILLFTNVLEGANGGIPVVNRLILRALGPRSCRGEVEIEALALNDPVDDDAQVPHRVGIAGARLRWRGFGGSKAAMLVAAARHRGGGDIVVSTHLGLAPVGRLLATDRARFYQFLHGIEAWRPQRPRVRWGLGRVDCFLSNSAFTHRRFIESNPALGAVDHRVCWLGVPAERLPELATSARQPDRDVLSVLMVGRLGPERYKGHDEMLAVWPRVRARFPRARLLIVGDGCLGGALRDVARSRGLIESGAVEFLGGVSDEELRRRYAECSIFAMPSRNEGFGLVYVEAMAHAKPCLASSDDAAAEIVVHGQTGLLVRQNDGLGLLDALSRLLADTTLRVRFGQAGRRRVAECFTEQRFHERILAALQVSATTSSFQGRPAPQPQASLPESERPQ
jgi:phosphatidylinositol alpha-1,6-mannosyltransferase